MDPTSLLQLRVSRDVETREGKLYFLASPSWIVEGEQRLSYATIIRLVECARELHWETDVAPFLGGTTNLDSTCKELHCQFTRPVEANLPYVVDFHVTGISETEYAINFAVRAEDQAACARADMQMVFIDSLTGRRMAPPIALAQHLRSISAVSVEP